MHRLTHLLCIFCGCVEERTHLNGTPAQKVIRKSRPLIFIRDILKSRYGSRKQILTAHVGYIFLRDSKLLERIAVLLNLRLQGLHGRFQSRYG